MRNQNGFETEIKVWDIFVRVFHWSLAIAFFVAYFSEDASLKLHAYVGYFIALLITLRIGWGLVGTKYARFTNFIYKPRKVVRYAFDLLRIGGKRYIGHSPAGGAMVLLLLIMMFLIVLSGVVTLAMSEGSGPLAGYLALNRAAGRQWKEIHEVLANITVGLVLVHICAVLWASLVHGENLIRAMWNGRKKQRLSDREIVTR
jgi:cytochrome b